MSQNLYKQLKISLFIGFSYFIGSVESQAVRNGKFNLAEWTFDEGIGASQSRLKSNTKNEGKKSFFIYGAGVDYTIRNDIVPSISFGIYFFSPHTRQVLPALPAQGGDN